MTPRHKDDEEMPTFECAILMILAAAFAWFIAAPAIHWGMFKLLNFIFNKNVPL